MTKNKIDIKILQTIVCDEVRREDNGKFFLIGVYSDAIFMNTIPANILLSFWIQCEIQLKEKKSLEFKIEGDALQKPVTFVSEIGNEQVFGKSLTIPIILRILLEIKSEGSFSIEYRMSGNENWISIRHVVVKRNADIANNN